MKDFKPISNKINRISQIKKIQVELPQFSQEGLSNLSYNFVCGFFKANSRVADLVRIETKKAAGKQTNYQEWSYMEVVSAGITERIYPNYLCKGKVAFIVQMTAKNYQSSTEDPNKGFIQYAKENNEKI